MTCKDCYLYGHCRYGVHICKNEKGEYIQFPASNDVGKDCEGFKDKSRILELPCKVGDFVEWDKGFGAKVLYRVNGFHYNPDDLGLRYILKHSSPIVGISHITKIIPEEEALRKAVEK